MMNTLKRVFNHLFRNPIEIISRYISTSSLFVGLKMNTNRLTNRSSSTLTGPKLYSSDLLAGTDVFIFDCDGVIWKGDLVIEGANEVLKRLRSLGKIIYFVTNNSTKSRKGFLSKFSELGITVYSEGDLL